MEMLVVSKVNKRFGNREVVKDLSFSIPEKSIFGFVGRNGAGKTTTMKMILGLLHMDSGEITVDGKKVSYGNTETNKVIGYLPDVPEFYDYMTPREYLMFCGTISGLDDKAAGDRADELLSLVGLGNEKKKIRGFSRGMKQRLGIAQALIGRPKLLICDEPTSALDPVGRKEILDILIKAKEETTVIFSTHILSDVERICDEVAFLHDGKIALSGTMEEIRKLRKKEEFEVVLSDKKDMNILKKGFNDIEAVDPYTAKIKQKDITIKDIINYLMDNNIDFEKVEKCESSLENLFMEVIK